MAPCRTNRTALPPLQGASAFANADRFVGLQRAARNPYLTLVETILRKSYIKTIILTI